MVQNQIRSLFLLFAGEEELPDAVQPVLDEAVLEVQQALKDGADEDDARLNWLAAAVAFLRYTEITAARDRAACTFAGTIAQNTDAAPESTLHEEPLHRLKQKRFIFQQRPA